MESFLRGIVMPESFNKCVDAGGRVRRKTLSDGRYINICWDKSGKSHAGEVHEKKGERLKKAIRS